MRALRVVIAAIWLSMGVHGALAEYREISVVDGGAVAGTVLVAGDVPVLPPQPVFKQLGFCGNTVPGSLSTAAARH